ncbi:TPA: transporter, partial [Streptococcus equi subsp. equi]|nr:transporter [Streptococcus equi subsp. equi]
DHQLFHFHYGQSLVIVDAVTIIGAMLGNLTPKDYFSRLSISKLVQTQGIAFLLVGVSNALQLPAIIGVLCLAFAAYIMGKATPKLDALLMENLPSDMLAQSNNFLGLLFSLSLPVGVFIFSFLALYNMTLCWILFMVLSLAALALSTSSTRG